MAETIVVVPSGGTGVNTFTAYAPLFGGTTAAGAVQSGTVGTAGQILTSNGAGALPTFQTAAGGSQVVLLATATASASSSLDFASVMSSSYSEYFFLFRDLLNSTTAVTLVRVSTNNGSTYEAGAGQYQATVKTQALNSAAADVNAAGTVTTGVSLHPSINGARQNGILRFVNTIDFETFFKFEGSHNSGTSWLQSMGYWASGGGGTINAIRLLPSAGTFTSGSVLFYGVKNT